MKKKLLLVLTCIFFSNIYAIDFTVNNINYTGTDSAPYTATVTGNNSFSGAADLSTVTYDGNTYSVTAVGDYAFASCYGLTSVIIEDSVTAIGDYAFFYCSGLTSVIIEDSVTAIRDYAFYYCYNLTSVTIGDSVTSIGNYAFGDCSGLTSVTIGESVTAIGVSVFYACTDLTTVTVGWTTAATIPVIDSAVFSGITLSNLTLNIPASTTNLYQAAAVWQGFGNFVEDTPATHLNFDGVNDYVEIPKTFNSDFTLEYLVKTTSVGSTGSQWYNGKSLLDGEVAGETTDLGTSIVGNKLAFGIGAPDTTIFSTSDINDGNWKHIAVSWEQSTGDMKIYINGVLENSGTSATATRTASNILRLATNIYGGNFFNGDMDDVRIWNIVRTATEINASKDCELQGNETGLVAYYKFNQGINTANNTAVTTLADATANANNGTLTNFALTGATSNWLSGSPITTGNTCTTLSASNFEVSTKLKMYPNPATNSITIDVANLTNANLQVLDITGKVIKNEVLKTSTNSIDIAQYPSGMYLFKVITSEGTVTNKVIKR